MRKSLVAAAAGALLMVTPAFAANGNGNNGILTPGSTVALLNKANVLDQEEIHAANMLDSKAGNNVALRTLANTLKNDHQVNDNAVHELASRNNINLEHYNNNNSSTLNNLNNLHGTAFDKQFLSMEAQDHQQALQEFKAARNQPQNPAMKMYLDETIPVLQAHLTMIQNMQRDMALENTAANNTTAANTAANTH